jgi:hypothetical protein
MARSRRLRAAIGVALLLGAVAVYLWSPWHGPIILSLSSSHGIDAGDLPALALLGLALAIVPTRRQGTPAGPRWPAVRQTAPVAAVVLGALLLAGIVDTSGGEPLLPAGGGTFDGTTQDADAPLANPVNRWSHLALTYDGTTLRLYVNGNQMVSHAATGAIRRTTDPLWIGGNRPYGEYFQGLIDEVRVYDRVLSPAEVRAEMSTPIRSARMPGGAGLVGGYAFDAGSGSLAADDSGRRNPGEIIGPTWTTRGRFGDALRFDGTGEVVRVPASASLDLRGAMTLSAWVRPSESQAGWRTIVDRQIDAYFLMAGGGGGHRLGAFDNVRAALLVVAAVWLGLVLASGRARWIGGRKRSWWPPVMLFLAGSVLDAALAPAGTLFGPALAALWYGLTSSHRGEAATTYLIVLVLTGVTAVSLAGQEGLELTREDGGIARSAGLGLLLVTAGVLSARYGSRGDEQQTRSTAPSS